MIADIFYPILTLKITVLAYFIRKKETKLFVGFSPTPSTGHHPGHSGELTAPPRPPVAILFGFSKNRCAHIFFVLSPVPVPIPGQREKINLNFYRHTSLWPS